MVTTNRNALRIIAVFPDSNQKIRVQWEIDTKEAGVGPFIFSLYRSGSPEGPWTLLSSTLTNVYTYDDTTALLSGMFKDVYYKVETGTWGSFPRSILNEMPRKKYLIARKIINDERVMLRAGQGTVLYVVKKKHFGTRCKRCYDIKTNQVIKSSCGDCYGTTFEGGYFTPIVTKGHIKPSAPGTDGTATTATPEVDSTNCMLQAFPNVVRGDFILEPEVNSRWEIVSVQPTEILRIPIHQDLTLSRLPRTHPIYKVPF